jgi:hypothetical protein
VLVNRCWICEADVESVDHLLLHCRHSESFVECLSSPDSAFVGLCLAQSKIYWLVGGQSGRSKSAVVWKMVPSVYYVVHLE